MGGGEGLLQLELEKLSNTTSGPLLDAVALTAVAAGMGSGLCVWACRPCCSWSVLVAVSPSLVFLVLAASLLISCACAACRGRGAARWFPRKSAALGFA